MPRRHRRSSEPTRREFIRATGCAALTASSIISSIWDLRRVNAAVADKLMRESSAGYKALVCIFLFGGNDANNLIIPTDARYNIYAAERGALLAIPQGQLLPLNSLNTPGQSYGMHPTCSKLQQLFNQGKLAVISNVGTLLYPTTKVQYQQQSVPLPPQLFSHSDQQVHWQTSIPDHQSRTGWGGRCADLLHSLNGNQTVSMSISLTAANMFEVGNIINQLNVSPGGAVSLTNLTAAQKAAMQDILNLPNPNLHRNEFAAITNRAIQIADLINSAISPTASANFWTVPFPGTTLGEQLKMIARLIHARSNPGINHSRQIYFAAVGGYDLHGGQVSGGPTSGAHANLLNELSEGMFAFQRAMEQLGVADNVVTFTASDFGRTLRNNGEGSDHGWGNHQIVMAGPGALLGQRFYGTFPNLAPDSADDIGTGRWLPTMAVDQYSATIARWFGVTETDLLTVFPNLGRFASSDIGFMNV